MTFRLALVALFAAVASSAAATKPTVLQAQAFIDRAETTLNDLNTKYNFAIWTYETYITYDTEKLSAAATLAYAAETAKLVEEARQYEKLDLPSDVRRKILLLKLSITEFSAPTPKDPREQKELADIQAWLQGEYGKGKYCQTPEKCLTLSDMEDVMRDSRDPRELLDVWKGWRTVSPPMRKKYESFVELSNKGARDLGFADTGVLWRSGYDMTPAEFTTELDRLWSQLQPLYDSLHAYVRYRLIEKYGKEAIGDDGLIPAHLLGNMWAQNWENIDTLVAPPASARGYDLTQILETRKFDAQEMVQSGERFFTSLGFDPLPKTFWERSLFAKPRDREVVCHAEAAEVENSQDVRIKMCIKPNATDFVTVHHELGHNFYQRAYAAQPFLFRRGANDGFHEALGDTIALSITPEYLKNVGLLDEVPGPEGDLGLLMKMALDRVAFLPFGLMVDQWRWKVFAGEVKPAGYNKAWWDLAAKYQGIKPPVLRSEGDFDPGAKYHVAANISYTRYFLAHVLEFQFYRALCKQASHTGPLHRCSFYGDKRAGERLNQMMAMGASRPWPDALEAMTGSRHMDASAIADYFAPLKTWLDTENAKRRN